MRGVCWASPRESLNKRSVAVRQTLPPTPPCHRGGKPERALRPSVAIESQGERVSRLARELRSASKNNQQRLSGKPATSGRRTNGSGFYPEPGDILEGPLEPKEFATLTHRLIRKTLKVWVDMIDEHGDRALSEHGRYCWQAVANPLAYASFPAV